MYNNYEEYTRDMNVCPYCRQNYYDNMYRGMQMCDVDNEEMENCYPEIYRIVKPMVKSTCQMYSNQRITKEIVEEMTMKIYTNIETQENRENETQRPLKNGDVINPNAKRENRGNREERPNYILKDLIKILLINELIGNKPNNNYRPGMAPPPPRPQGEFYPPYDRPVNRPPQPRQF